MCVFIVKLSYLYLFFIDSLSIYLCKVVWLVDLGFNVPPTAKIIWRGDLDLLSNPID